MAWTSGALWNAEQKVETDSAHPKQWSRFSRELQQRKDRCPRSLCLLRVEHYFRVEGYIYPLKTSW